jgi:hypothetical protein
VGERSETERRSEGDEKGTLDVEAIWKTSVLNAPMYDRL